MNTIPTPKEVNFVKKDLDNDDEIGELGAGCGDPLPEIKVVKREKKPFVLKPHLTSKPLKDNDQLRAFKESLQNYKK